MQPNQPPFTPPTAPPPGGPGNAASRLQGPAISLMVVSVLGILNALWGLATLGARRAQLAQMADQPQFQQFRGLIENFGASPIGSIIGLVLCGFIFFGAFQMRQTKMFGVAVAASIISVIPCFSPCCCVGIPFGIWALVVLFDPNVRASFQS